MLLAVVGPVVVLQQTPLEVIALPPSEVIFPPLWAVEVLILVTAVVINAEVTAAAEMVLVSFLQPFIINNPARAISAIFVIVLFL